MVVFSHHLIRRFHRKVSDFMSVVHDKLPKAHLNELKKHKKKHLGVIPGRFQRSIHNVSCSPYGRGSGGIHQSGEL